MRIQFRHHALLFVAFAIVANAYIVEKPPSKTTTPPHQTEGLLNSATIAQSTESQSDLISGKHSLLPHKARIVTKKRPTGVVARQTKIQSAQEFQEYLAADTELQRYTVVKFHASWCKTCAKFGLKFDQLASQHADWVRRDGAVERDGNLRIASVEWSQNQELCQSLQIEKLPTVHIYNGAGEKVFDIACPPSQFQQLTDQVDNLLAKYEKESKERNDAKELKEMLNQVSIAAVDISYRSRSFEYTPQRTVVRKQRWWNRFGIRRGNNAISL